jgi:hypothetical protein
VVGDAGAGRAGENGKQRGMRVHKRTCSGDRFRCSMRPRQCGARFLENVASG